MSPQSLLNANGKVPGGKGRVDHVTDHMTCSLTATCQEFR